MKDGQRRGMISKDGGMEGGAGVRPHRSATWLWDRVPGCPATYGGSVRSWIQHEHCRCRCFYFKVLNHDPCLHFFFWSKRRGGVGPDTVVWENSIPKAWYHWDGKEGALPLPPTPLCQAASIHRSDQPPIHRLSPRRVHRTGRKGPEGAVHPYTHLYSRVHAHPHEPSSPAAARPVPHVAWPVPCPSQPTVPVAYDSLSLPLRQGSCGRRWTRRGSASTSPATGPTPSTTSSPASTRPAPPPPAPMWCPSGWLHLVYVSVESRGSEGGPRPVAPIRVEC